MISLCVADDEPVIRQGLVSLPWESVGVRLVDEILAAVRKAGEEVAATKSTNLRLRLLEAELGRRQLVMDDAGIILGEVSHQGVADQVLRYIVDNQAAHITLTSMSRDLSFSSIYLSRVIKKATGYTFLELLNGLRVQEAARLLRETSESFVRITERVGAVDSRYFGQVFKRAYGAAPSGYRKEPTTPLDAKLAFTLTSLRAHRDHA